MEIKHSQHTEVNTMSHIVSRGWTKIMKKFKWPNMHTLFSSIAVCLDKPRKHTHIHIQTHNCNHLVFWKKTVQHYPFCCQHCSLIPHKIREMTFERGWTEKNPAIKSDRKRSVVAIVLGFSSKMTKFSKW